MSSGQPPTDQYYTSLPKSISGAGVIFHDPAGRVLLVEPAYRNDTWEIPGGGLDNGEYPWDAACGEVKEELGITLKPGRLLAVDWVPPQPDGRPALSNYVFDGGRLSEEQARTQLRLPPEELSGWRFAAADEWPQLLLPHMVRRVHACINALATGGTAYLHHGWPPADLH